MSERNIVTVSQLNNYVKMLLQTDQNLKNIYLCGEISNFTNHYKSGHFYLSLKDNGAVVKAVMFKFNAQKIKFVPEDGMKVICKGRVSLYERDGNYQFYIEDMEPEGVGALQIAYQQLCEKLKGEGLFDVSHKLAVPKAPQKIAIVTSPTGAALHDIVNILSRRYPIADVTLYPVLVQGSGAADSMIKALDYIHENSLADVIIIGRGGGSLEDLWAFNDENLARKIYSLTIPIVSAVGHEVDFTICDFVSDLRAPTPSAAAELASPDKTELVNYINGLVDKTEYILSNYIAQKQDRIKFITEMSVLSKPDRYIDVLYERLDKDSKNLENVFSIKLSQYTDKFKVNVAKLNAYSPLNTLARGYALVYSDNKVLKSTKNIKTNDNLDIKLADGVINCTVNNVTEN